MLVGGCAKGGSSTAAPGDDGDTSQATTDTLPRGAIDDPASPENAAEVVRQYYAAIDAGDYRGAYDLWGGEGSASGKTFDEFVAGFQHTSQTEATVGEPGRVDGAAGSRYVEVPVTIRAVTDHGEEQRFSGRYVMRRVMVDGATEAQRRWHIDSAKIKIVR